MGYTSRSSRTLPPAAAETVILVADSCLGLTLLAALGFRIWESGGDKLTSHLPFKERALADGRQRVKGRGISNQ